MCKLLICKTKIGYMVLNVKKIYKNHIQKWSVKINITYKVTSNQIKKHKNFYSCPCTNSVSMQTPVEVRTDNDNEHNWQATFWYSPWTSYCSFGTSQWHANWRAPNWIKAQTFMYLTSSLQGNQALQNTAAYMVTYYSILF